MKALFVIAEATVVALWCAVAFMASQRLAEARGHDAGARHEWVERVEAVLSVSRTPSPQRAAAPAAPADPPRPVAQRAQPSDSSSSFIFASSAR